MAWSDYIGSCFGIEDKKFALHPSDISAASELLAKAQAEGVGFAEYVEAIKQWMVAQGCSPAHIAEQLVRVKNVTTYFIGD
ncbi:hypothetical protein [Shewanella glacialipiscicola]|uniref:Uncharacterized protein n=1 Tax=Shewanella glacialipiscicola TaxID=614069 RepID=A0ABQ6JAC2_9GAMM|nr:hypothetical protein [Shewanella glacialipiscicola]MCL1087090.1 hypothetical protein [Shewanella glacialipiscicola]GIU11965.1 hypothetical protein TUM4636_21480 [Shewanella glacialipiscicola]GMA84408.1 hypothetical protein GCM10025855_39410 [Shewanella glacialipiscicola]GMA84499.1 hypothetical protein GCM10025855_40320 [Shewanella glacialipiscicola]